MRGLDDVLELLFHVYAVAFGFQMADPRRMGNTHKLGDCRADLRRIAVCGLLAAEDEVKVARAADGLR